MNLTHLVTIDPATFVADAEQDNKYLTSGTIEMTLSGKTKRVAGYMMHASETIGNPAYYVAHGIVGRYQTGGKLWSGSVTRRVDPTTGKAWSDVRFGFDSRSGKHKKAGGVWFKDEAPEARISKR